MNALEQGFVVQYAIGLLGSVAVGLFLYFYLADSRRGGGSIPVTVVGVLLIPIIVGGVAGAIWYIASGKSEGSSVPLPILLVAVAIVSSAFFGLLWFIGRMRDS